MSWTATRPIARFGLVAGSSVAVGAEQGRWDDTQKKYLSNLSKQTRQRTELSHRAALSVMCYWKNAGGIKLWTQRDGHSIGFWHGWNSAFENLPSFIGSNIAAPFICENLWFLYIVILGISLPNTGVLPVFLFFFSPLSDSPDVTESQEVLFYVFLLKCLFLSIHGWGCFVCCHHPWFRVCGDSNGLTVGREKGCHGSESGLFAHVQTSRMDDGFSLRWTFLPSQPLWLETWEPRLE